MNIDDIKNTLGLNDTSGKSRCPNCETEGSFTITEFNGFPSLYCLEGCEQSDIEDSLEKLLEQQLDGQIAGPEQPVIEQVEPQLKRVEPKVIEAKPEQPKRVTSAMKDRPIGDRHSKLDDSERNDDRDARFILGSCESITPDEAIRLANDRGFVLSPNDVLPIKEAAAEIAKKINGVAYLQDGVPKFRFDGDIGFCELNEKNFVSFVECFGTVAEVMKTKVGKELNYVAKQCLLSPTKSRSIINSVHFLRSLDEIELCIPFPIVIERDGKPEVVKGYDPKTKVFAEDWNLPEVSLDDAIANLLEIVADYNFESESDRSRAVASLITPMMSFGKHIQNRVPLDYTEAEKSQSGKSYRNRLTSAVYGVSTPAISKGDRRERLEESLNKNIADGHPFIALDNIKNNLDSEEIESLITGEHHHCRAPWLQKDANPRNHIFMLTTNGARLSPDLANRICVVRILESNASPKQYPEGDILAHILANKERFLASAIRIVSEWIEQGKQEKPATLRDFRKEWSQKLDWIIQEIFGLKPLLEGHEEITGRVSSSAANRIRNICLAIQQAGKLNEFLSATDILDICKSEEMTLLDSKGDELKNFSLGRELSLLYGGEETFSLEKFTVRLDEQPNPFDSSKKNKRHYFEMNSPDQEDNSPDSPPDNSPNKTLVSLDPPNECQDRFYTNELKDGSSDSDYANGNKYTRIEGIGDSSGGNHKSAETPLRGEVLHCLSEQPPKETALSRAMRLGRERAEAEAKRGGDSK